MIAPSDFDPVIVERYGITEEKLAQGDASMRVRYRLIEKFYRGDGWFQRWFPWGVLYENCSGCFPETQVLIRSFPDDDRQTARHMGRRVVELEMNIEGQIELVDESYPIRFRVLPAIHWVEGKDYRAVRQRLWDVLFDAMRAREARKEEQSAAPVYVSQPAYHLARETTENGRTDKGCSHYSPAGW